MRRSLLFIGLLLCVGALSAQTLTSYFCDFENAAENSQWQLNTGPRGRGCKNQWTIGAAGAFGVNSQAGLFISSDDGASMSYVTTQSEIVVAYRELTLAAGNYTLRFDWLAMGGTSEGVYICWIDDATPDFETVYSVYNQRANANPTTLTYLPADAVRYYGASAWRSETVTITSNGRMGKLAFLWFNTRLTTPSTPSAAIDNIEIYQGTCAAPTNMHYDGRTTSLQWTGTAGEYELMMFNQFSQTKTELGSVTGTSVQMPDMASEGMYTFYVRSACDATKHSKWTTFNKFVWMKGVRCIDFLDLTSDNSGAAKCFAGSTDNIKVTRGQIDYGYGDEKSQHTIHYVQGETDPRTGNQLKTIPDGEIASIRLGGYWQTTGNMSSTVEYEYNVQAGVSDLLELKYATILEYADYHSEAEEARFKLEVLRNGTPVDGCSQGDFKAGFGDTQSWHQYTYENDRVMYWCDWQTVTVSLRQYVGQRLTIRLTSYSCTQTIHIGYAYFTLNCRGGGLEGIACGDFSTDHFDAPEGFNYRWYKEGAPQTILGTNSRFDVGRDDSNIYLVDLISKTNSRCYYTLVANPNPRFPHVRASARPAVADCENRVWLTQESSVVYINRTTLDSLESEEPVESVRWNFGDGTPDEDAYDASVMHVFPKVGGDYEVLCIASMNGGICEDTARIHLTLPDLFHTDVFDTVHTCEAEHVDTHGVRHLAADSTYYVDTVGQITNQYGCEGTHVRRVYFHAPYDTLYRMRMCEGGTYRWAADGKSYTTDTTVVLALKTIHDCDSVITLRLIVDPALTLSYPDSTFSCADDGLIEVPYTVLTGMLDSVFVRFDSAGIANGFEPEYGFKVNEPVLIPIPETARPDNYHVVVDFSSQLCPYGEVPMVFQTHYSASVVMQNGGFIGIMNSGYNGGYDFVGWQWFRNGELKPEVEKTYLPVGPEDIGAEYVLLLTRAGEDYAIPTCPIYYSGGMGLGDLRGELPVSPAVVNVGGALTVRSEEPFTVYSIMGKTIARYAGGPLTIQAPTMAGMYVIRSDNNRTARILVR